MKVTLVGQLNDIKGLEIKNEVETFIRVNQQLTSTDLGEGLSYQTGLLPQLEYFFVSKYKDKLIVSPMRVLKDTGIMEVQARLFKKELKDYHVKIDEEQAKQNEKSETPTGQAPVDSLPKQ
jgi:hypothetical protein